MLLAPDVPWVTSERVRELYEGPGLGAFCEGMRESRERGRLCVCVDERPRPCGVAERFVSIACCGLPMRTPQVHVPAFPDSSLPGVDSITESRTLYL
jgi:hypothetical protein